MVKLKVSEFFTILSNLQANDQRNEEELKPLHLIWENEKDVSPMSKMSRSFFFFFGKMLCQLDSVEQDVKKAPRESSTVIGE